MYEIDMETGRNIIMYFSAFCDFNEVQHPAYTKDTIITLDGLLMTELVRNVDTKQP